MNFYDCPECRKKHPWLPGKQPCPLVGDGLKKFVKSNAVVEESLSKRVRLGRARLELRDKTIEALKPWVTLGMSRRTWYRRRKEKGGQVHGDET